MAEPEAARKEGNPSGAGRELFMFGGLCLITAGGAGMKTEEWLSPAAPRVNQCPAAAGTCAKEPNRSHGHVRRGPGSLSRAGVGKAGGSGGESDDG